VKPHPVDELIRPPSGPAPAGWVCAWPLPAYCATSAPPARPSEDDAGEVGAVVASPHHAAMGLARGRQAVRRARAAEGEAHELAAELEASQAELRRLRRTGGCPDV
jgi:hypothetical protein